MAKKVITLFLCLTMAVGLLCGCNSSGGPTLPKLDLDDSTFTGTVEYVNGRTCRVAITEGDSHFDAPYVTEEGKSISGDVVQVTYTDLKGSKSVQVGDSVTVHYNYITDVSERNGDPHITIQTLTVK